MQLKEEIGLRFCYINSPYFENLIACQEQEQQQYQLHDNGLYSSFSSGLGMLNDEKYGDLKFEELQVQRRKNSKDKKGKKVFKEETQRKIIIINV